MRPGELQRRLRQLMAEALALSSRIDRDRTEERAVAIELEGGRSNDLRFVSRHEHGLHAILHAGKRKIVTFEQRANVGQIASPRSLNDHCRPPTRAAHSRSHRPNYRARTAVRTSA